MDLVAVGRLIAELLTIVVTVVMSVRREAKSREARCERHSRRLVRLETKAGLSVDLENGGGVA